MKLQLKRSNVLVSGGAKEPTAAQLDYGELAINYSAGDAAIFLKNSTNNVIRIAGVGNIADDGLTNVPTTTSPPTTPTPEAGNLWYNSEDGRLYIYYVDDNSSQWVDASPDTWQTTVIPDTTNPAHQAGTLDDRYINTNGDTLTGALLLDNAATVATPDLAFDGDLNTGIYSPGADSLAITTAGTQRVTVDSSGRLLVGTSAAPSVGIPASATFVVQGYVGSTTGDSLISLQRGQAPASISSGAQLGAITFGANDGSPYAQIHAATDGSGGTSDYPGRLVFSTTADTGSAPAERLRIDSSGNIGIGGTATGNFGAIDKGVLITGTNTSVGLRVETSHGSSGILEMYAESGGSVLDTRGSGHIRFASAGTEFMRITSSGRLGIGTTAPVNRIVIASTGATPAYLQSVNASSGSGATDGVVMGLGNASDVYYWNYENGSQIWATNASERMRIDSSGNVGIGRTPVSGVAGYVLQLRGNSTQSYLQFSTATQGDTLSDGFVIGSDNTNASIIQRENADLRFATNDIERMRIDSSGNVQIGTTTSNGAKLKVSDGGAHEFAFFPDDSGVNSLVNYNRSGGAYVDMSIAAKEVSFKTGTSPTERLRIDSSGLVNVTGGIQVTENVTPTTGSGVEIFKPTSTAGQLQAFNRSGSTWMDLILKGNTQQFHANGSERMRIGPTGLVGVGTTAPTDGSGFGNCIDIQSATGGAVYMRSSSDTTNDTFIIGRDGANSFFISKSGNIIFNNAGAERMRIDSLGQLLLGTTAAGFGNAADNLTIADNGNCGMTIRSASAYAGSLYFADGTSGSANYAGFIDYQHSVDALRFGTGGGQERMRIDSSGSVFIGCTSNPVSGAGGVAFVAESSGRRTLIASSTTSSNVPVAIFSNSNGQVGSIATSGTSTSYNTSSDYRLKENVVDIADGITRVKQLAPKRFNFIADDTTTVDGFLAHEAQTVVPEAVTGEKDGEEMQGIDQSKLVPLLTAALQEAISEIETLKQRLSDAGIA